MATAALPAEDAAELGRLIEAAGFFELPDTLATPSGGADRLSYTISVASPERSRSVSVTDPVEDPHLGALVDYLESRA